MGQNIVQLRPDGIVEITVVGKQSEEVIDEMTFEFLALVESRSLGTPPVLADATRMVGSGAGTRQASRRALSNAPFSHLAVYGAGSSFVRHIIQMILDAFGDRRMGYFGSREDAIAWLIQEEAQHATIQRKD